MLNILYRHVLQNLRKNGCRLEVNDSRHAYCTAFTPLLIFLTNLLCFLMYISLFLENYILMIHFLSVLFISLRTCLDLMIWNQYLESASYFIIRLLSKSSQFLGTKWAFMDAQVVIYSSRQTSWRSSLARKCRCYSTLIVKYNFIVIFFHFISSKVDAYLFFVFNPITSNLFYLLLNNISFLHV
jgi:hypothetical protein